jgi:hypothetical protein
LSIILFARHSIIDRRVQRKAPHLPEGEILSRLVPEKKTSFHSRLWKKFEWKKLTKKVFLFFKFSPFKWLHRSRFSSYTDAPSPSTKQSAEADGKGEGQEKVSLSEEKIKKAGKS